MYSSYQITELLTRWSNGDEKAAAELIPFVYDKLRAMAKFRILRERPGHTLQPTELVHEAYIKLTKQEKKEWANRAHFLAIAALAMRQVLVDRARARNREKGPGKHVHLSLEEAIVFSDDQSDSFLMIDEALKALAQKKRRAARVLELRVFGGLTNQELAFVLGVSENTVIRDWNDALAILGTIMRKGNDRRSTQEG